ncbi:hypothetical protein BDV97DRAFT_122721 [Delphinella strobiligena]|nr:hypothetical protein BDV97DRAFT_122721 [Delphinella strobiligena]
MASQQSWWERTRTGGKVGFDKIYNLVDKLGAPVNKLTNKIGSEAFWPTTLDKESDKAARILRSFCKDGFYQEEKMKTAEGPTAKQRVLKKIPSEVIRNAKGLAIFTTMRTGLWVSGAGGSGVLVARTADGSWSPPSGILLHTAGLGFLVGVDIYDCVVVINTQKALDAFSKIRCTLGGEISAVAGPVGAGGVLETELHKRQAPVFTYMKSRGFYAGIQFDGTVIIERGDENERFYGQRLKVEEILAGKVRHPPYEVRQLLETIKAAQGDRDVDESILPSEPPPGDFEIEDSTHIFGVPDKEDPDPYGVRALEKEGMSIREAGTHKRASWEQFAFQPAPSSPIYSTFSARTSVDRDGSKTRTSTRSSWNTTAQLSNSDTIATGASSLDQKRPTPARVMTDMSTQTEPAEEHDSGRSSARSSVLSKHQSLMNGIPEDSTSMKSPRPTSLRKTSSHSSGRQSHSRDGSRSESPVQNRIQKPGLPKRDLKVENQEADDSLDASGDDTAEDTDLDIAIDEPVVHQVQKATAPQFISRARLVEVPKRVAPKLPPRNPNRRGPIVVNADPDAESGAEHESEQGSPSQSPTFSVKTATSSSKDQLAEKFEEANMSPGETPDETPDETDMRNPWGSIIAKHNGSQDSLHQEMPGAFHSLPPTPDERNEAIKI